MLVPGDDVYKGTVSVPSIGSELTRDQTYIGNDVFVPSAYQRMFIAKTYSIKVTANIRYFSQAERIYKGQNLGQFFTEWLTHDRIERQNISLQITAGEVECDWIKA